LLFFLLKAISPELFSNLFKNIYKVCHPEKDFNDALNTLFRCFQHDRYYGYSFTFCVSNCHFSPDWNDILFGCGRSEAESATKKIQWKAGNSFKKIHITKTVTPKASSTSLFHSKNLFQISKFFRNFADYYPEQSEIAKTDIDNKTIKSKTMPKLKTKSGAKKRFALTGSGKIKRKNAYKSHILTKKETKQKRNLTTTSYVAAVDEKSVLRQLAIK